MQKLHQRIRSPANQPSDNVGIFRGFYWFQSYAQAPSQPSAGESITEFHRREWVLHDKWQSLFYFRFKHFKMWLGPNLCDLRQSSCRGRQKQRGGFLWFQIYQTPELFNLWMKDSSDEVVFYNSDWRPCVRGWHSSIRFSVLSVHNTRLNIRSLCL